MSSPSETRSEGLIGRTLATDVLHRLRDDIISCALKPGERLRFEALREIYGVSFSTLREALAQLASERLVVAEGQRGFIVAPISREDLLDLTDARVLVERECLRRAMEHGDSAWEAQILSAFHRLDRVEARMPASGSASSEWDARHFDFHESLVASAGSLTLSEIRKSLFERARRYRRLSAAVRQNPRAKRDEHRTLMEAVLSRDVAYAQDLLERHIRETSANVLAAISEEAPGQTAR
ncbi:MAG TPA: FCD domain-containing protein [Phenylobacterium sp.]|uniref:GntR family transcriptional regulator n=1 Tax=Phenylobacterium sp. TaxID=1871053 RepID=UPI002B48A18A|nr:FCD domain-containing protein [Phenylobacterium sp.]HKR86908.1 FCD domain-containing protein [Phenylobacterium sp.]